MFIVILIDNYIVYKHSFIYSLQIFIYIAWFPQFPPGISTGDGGLFDMKISNNVYNTLKTYSKAEDKRSNRLHDKREKATAVCMIYKWTYFLLLIYFLKKLWTSLPYF